MNLQKLYQVKIFTKIVKTKRGKMKSKYFVAIIFVILLIGLVSASFEIGDESHSITKSYSSGEIVRGWFNISLSDEPTNSLFGDSFANSISLIDLINENSEFEHSCSILDCLSDYTAENGEASKSISLTDEDSELIGFQFDVNMDSVNLINFTIESNAGESCFNQLKVDLLNDGSVEEGNDKVFNEVCPQFKRDGCFDSDNQNLAEGDLGSIPYCQRIRLSESPGFELGAWVKKIGGTSETLRMVLYDINGQNLVNCELPEASTQGGEISCDVSYLVPEQNEHYVCIYSESSGNYKVRGYPDSNGCAFNSYPSSDENYAYQIFAQGKKFDSVGTIEVSNTLAEKVEEYIVQKYGGLNCTTGCVVPIKLISQEGQDITIKDLSAKYGIGGGLTGESSLFYDLTETPAKVTAGFQKLYLDNGKFILPSSYGDFNFQLKLGGTEIFSEDIAIAKIPAIKGLTPTTTASGYPTTFTVIIDSAKNITDYEWDFGDGESETTATNKATHTYNSTGEYELKVTIINSNDESFSKTFDVSIGSAEYITEELLEDKLNYFNNLSNKIKTYESFYQSSLKSVLQTDLIEEKLKQLEKDYAGAVSDEDYADILGELLNLDVPKSISIGTNANAISFYPDEHNININILKTIGGGDYDSSNEDLYIDAVLGWNLEKMQTKMDFTEMAAVYDDYEESVLRVFELDISQKDSLSYEPYFIIQKLDGLEFNENYLEKEADGYVYITLEHPEQTIAFSTTENVDFLNLPAFISPPINRLSTTGDYSTAEEGGNKWLWFILAIIIIFAIGIAGYIILQQWYKHKYESHLFKGKSQLFNLAVFIRNSKEKGMTDKQIVDKLKKAGWKSEQIKYVMKKYAGKKTGMFEIPIDKILNLFKKKSTQNIVNK